MSYDVKCWQLAVAFSEGRLTDPEIAKLAQSIQTHLEEDIETLLFFRKEPHAGSGYSSDPID